MGELTASALASATSVAVAATSGDKLLTIVATVVNAAILLANGAITIYRKWRDRDKDLNATKKSDTEGNDNGGNGEQGEP